MEENNKPNIDNPNQSKGNDKQVASRRAKTAKLAAFSVEERFAKNAEETLAHKKKLIDKGFQCSKCWMIKRVCICEKMPKDVKLKNNVIIYMHFKEFGRSSNTGLDLTNACPNAKLLLCGIPEHEKTLHDIMYKKSEDKEASTNGEDQLTFNENTFVLFPSNDSVTAQEFLDKLRANKKKKEEVNTSTNNNNNDEEESLEPAAKRRRIEVDPVNVIVLDATWNQARALYKRLPTGLPKVRLSETKETISHLRKQTVEGRVTTAEATLLLLEELGEDKEELSKLWQGLKHRIAAVDSATGRKNEHSEDEPEHNEESSIHSLLNHDEVSPPVTVALPSVPVIQPIFESTFSIPIGRPADISVVTSSPEKINTRMPQPLLGTKRKASEVDFFEFILQCQEQQTV